MGRSRFLSLGVLAFALVVATQAHAEVISLTTGSAEFVTPVGVDLANGMYVSSKVRVFNEKTNVLVTNLSVTTLVSTLPAGDFVLAGYGPAGSSGLLSGGVNSHLLHFDPDGSSPTIDAIIGGPHDPAHGSVTFDNEILGLIFDTPRLNATDALLGLGAASVLYSTDGARDLEQHNADSDRLWLSADRKTLFYNWLVPGVFDEVRVITSTPEPTGFVLAALGGAGLWLARRRKSR